MKTRILIVEDEMMTAKHLQLLLQAGGYAVCAVTALGEDAVVLAAAHLPDLVLMDIELAGEMDGVDAARQIHAQLQIPVVYLTAYNTQEIFARAKITAPYSYILKPFQERELFINIEIALYQHHLDQQLAHLNVVLRTIRAINRAMIRERDHLTLLQHICHLFIDIGGYDAAWVMLLNDSAMPVMVARAGAEWTIDPNADVLRTAMQQPDIVLINDDAAAPPLPGKMSFQKLCVRLAFEETVYGVLGLSAPAAFIGEAEEHALLKEAADDLAFGLHTIEMDAQRRSAEAQLCDLNANLEDCVKRRTAQIEAANNELKEFAYIVSHDLKAPLRGITQLVHWLIEDYSDAFDLKGKDMAALLIERVKHMDHLIDGILQYSRIGWHSGKPVEIDLNALVREVIDLLAPPPDIHVIIADDLPVVVGDQTRIEQIFQNLLSNAVKSIEKPEGKITIHCVAENASWRFSITDNGRGIEEKHYEKISQLFQTISPSGMPEGTGIGLTLVKKIVESHGGRIWLESAIGKGSTFFFTLPKR